MKKTIISSICLLLAVTAQASEVKSPNGEISVNFSLNGSVPTYSVKFRDRDVVLPK